MGRKLIVVLILVLSLTGCQFFKQDEAFNYLDKSKESQRIVFYDPDAESLFLKVYAIDHMVSHSLYSVEDALHFEIFFDGDVSRLNIQNARNYFTQLFLIKDMRFTEVPYWYDEIIDKGFITGYLRIFVEDELYLYESFNKEDNSRTYYENHDRALPFKLYEKPEFVQFKKDLEERVENVEVVSAFKPIKDSILILRVESIEEMDVADRLVVKEKVENDLAPLYDNEMYWPYAPNTSYLGLVVQFYEQERLYEEEVYFNSGNKRWLEVEWENFDFFRANTLETVEE